MRGRAGLPRVPGLLSRPLRRAAPDARGSVAVLVAVGAAGLMAAAALGVDLGLLFQASRKAQGAVDIAAMVAAADLDAAEAQARRSLADNGYGAGSIAIVPGRYAADAGLAPGSRFQAGGTPANAVRVALATTARAHFARVLGLPSEVGIRAAGVAARAQFASFAVGSGLASLDGGIANAILGSMLGTTLSLRAMDYDALLAARVDAFRFLDALSVGLGLQAARYSDVVAASASAGQVLSALRVAVQGQAGASAALGAVIAALPGTTPAQRVGKLLDLGDAAALAPSRGSAGPMLSLMDLVAGTASVANGDRQVSVDLGATVPGLLRTRLTLAVGERRQDSGWVQPGGANATVRTAQMRLLIETSLSAPLGLGTLSLPIYVEAASARASLRSVTCPWSSPSRRAVSIDAQTGVASLAVADVAGSAVTVAGAGPDLSRSAPLLSLSLPPLTVRAGARVGLAGSYARTLSFSDDDIARHTVRSVSATGMAASAVRGLLDGLTLDIDGLAPSPLLRPALSLTLQTAAPAIDAVLDSTLRTLGIHLGIADVSVDGTRCDQAVLVQ